MNVLLLSLITTVILMIIIAIAVRFFISKGNLNNRAYLFVLFGFIGMGFLIFGSFVQIKANQVGIIFDDFDGLKEEVKTEGFQKKSIFEHIIIVETSNKTTQLEVAAQTSDSAYATFKLSIIYKIEAKNAGRFYKSTNNKDISTEQLSSLVKEALQSTTIQHDIYAILGDQLETVRSKFTDALSAIMLDRYALTLVSTSFDDVDAGDRIEEIIKNKAEALQQIEIAEAEKKRATIDAEKKEIEAKAQAEVEKIKAEAEVEITRQKAEAEAYKVETEKNAIIKIIDKIYQEHSGTLTYEKCAEIVLQTVFYENWDGKLPDVLTSDSLSSLIGSLISGS